MKAHYSFPLFLAAIFTLGIAGCKKDNANNSTDPIAATGPKIAPDGFKFATAKDVTINITLKAPNNDALAGVVVTIYNPADLNEGNAIFKGVTDKSGNLTAKVSVAAYVTKLVIDPAYLGLMRYATANITNNTVTATIGGQDGFGGDIVVASNSINPQTVSATNSSKYRVNTFSGPTDYVYPAPYTSAADAIFDTGKFPFSAGRPKYIEATPDVVDAQTLSYINATLPEGKPVTTYHKEYLLPGSVNTINVTSTTTVAITFITGNTGGNHTLAYYTYQTNNPPKSVNDITKATYVFPYSSNKSGSKTLLQPGDKVKLGTFNAGTSIGFILVQDGWAFNGIDLNKTKWYSHDAFNTDNASRHGVMAYDDTHKFFLFGFDDSARPSGDFDFNDLAFIVTPADINAINTTGVSPIDTGKDTDGDGITDISDEFPNDASKAFTNYFPSQTGYAQLAFEDNWPKKGDYDLNDVVVNYRYTFVTNAQNQVVTMQGDYSVVAAGASFKNGFGVQLPVSASAVKSVTGQRAMSNYIQLASNGVESGQTKAVIVPFDNFNTLVNNTDNAFFINTLMAKDKVQSSTASVLVTFNSPISQSGLSISTLNPFLISNLRRGYEIHLPGYAATDKADSKLFGTDDDASVASSGKTYVSKENWPWAISYNGVFNYPVEGVIVSKAYPRFLDWATSAGAQYGDWYINTGAGYRDSQYIYSK